MRKLLTVALMTGLLVGTVGGTTPAGQDITTILSKFLQDLYAGNVGTYQPITNITLATGGALRTGTTAGNTLLLQAYDTDTGPAYWNGVVFTAGTAPTATYSVNQTTIIGPDSTAATIQLGADAAGTTAYTLKGNDRITSSGVGGDLTIAAGRGYDAAAGGSIYFQTAPTAGAGSAGVLTTRLTIDPTGKVTAAGSVAIGGQLDVTTSTYVGAGYAFAWTGRSIMWSASDGTNYLSNQAGTGYTTLNLGPTTGNTANGTMSISKVQVTCTIATDTNCSGKGTATITTSTGIPAGSLVLGVDARVTTIIAGSDGIATWNLGTATDPDAWGAGLALAAGTTTGIANFTVTAPAYYTGATNITFTGTGGKVIDSGVIKITIYYIALTPISA